MTPAMRVGLVQYRPRREQTKALRELAQLAREAARGCDLVVLPEMASTPYVFDRRDEASRFAEAPTGPTFTALSGVARECHSWLVAGYIEAAGSSPSATSDLYNSALVIDDHGELRFSYRKTLLYPSDEVWARPGDSGYRAFDTRAGRFGVGICMDLNDDGFVAWVRASKLDALAFPTKWIDEGEDVWPYWVERMAGSGAALVAANAWGAERDLRFSGRSAVIRDGIVLASAGRTGNAARTADLAATASATR